VNQRTQETFVAGKVQITRAVVDAEVRQIAAKVSNTTLSANPACQIERIAARARLSRQRVGRERRALIGSLHGREAACVDPGRFVHALDFVAGDRANVSRLYALDVGGNLFRREVASHAHRAMIGKLSEGIATGNRWAARMVGKLIPMIDRSGD